MRAIPVDVSAFTGFMCVEPPTRKVDLRTGEVRKDTASGLDLFVVSVVAIRPGDPSVIKISVPGEMPGIVVGTPVRITGLEAAAWDVEGRSGVAFRATAVSAADAPSPGASAGPGGPDAAGRRPGMPPRGGDGN